MNEPEMNEVRQTYLDSESEGPPSTASASVNQDGLTDQQKHMLSRLDQLLPAVEDIHNTLERKLQFNFGLMSSIVTILIVGNISWFDNSRLDADEHVSFAVFVLSFVAVAACSLYAHFPRERLVSPMTPTWCFLSKWWDYSSEDYAKQVLLSYESIWTDDRCIRKRKARATMLSHLGVVIGLVAAFYESGVSLRVFGAS